MNDQHFTPPLAPDLLLRPHPSRHEGPRGYLLRLAEANCMTLSDLSQAGIHFDPDCLSRHQLLPDPSLDPHLHAHVVRVAQLAESKGRVWNMHHARFCPQCLAEDPTWQASWEIYFLDVCPKHGVWMVDQCGSCGQPLKWTRDSLLRCQCGSDLREETSGPAPDNLRRLSAVLEDKLLRWPEGEAPAPLTYLDADQTQRLIRFLGTHMDPMANPRPLKLRNSGRLEGSWPVSTLAAEIIFRWPEGFHQALNQLQSNSSGEKKGLRDTFQHAYTYLYKGFKEAGFSDVRKAFEEWITVHWKGGVAGRNRRLPEMIQKNAQWIPGTVAAHELGISLKQLRRLITEGNVEWEEFLSTAGRKFLMVRRDQLVQIQEQLSGEITMEKAMEMLGLGKVRMQRLLTLLFPSARRIWDKEHLPWRIPRGEVEALLEVVTDLPVLTIAEEHQVSLGYVLKFWHWTGDEILALVEAVKAGALKPQAFLDGARGITRWIFDIAQLRALQQRLNSGRSNWVSIPEMARILGVKQQVAYWLTHHGFVHAERLGCLKNLGSRVSREELERFQQNHVLGKEIAEILGCSSKKMSLMLAEQGIYPLRGEGPTPCRMLIYSRDSEVQRFLVQVTGSDPREFRLVGFLGSAVNIQ